METLFHECGHALNSLLSRTEFQHLSGETWCEQAAAPAAWARARGRQGLPREGCRGRRGASARCAPPPRPPQPPEPALPITRRACAGTRGPADMVEVPSHTLELFASDPRVLALFARHRGTGQALPAGVLAQLEASRRRFAGLDQQQQVGGRGRSPWDCVARLFAAGAPASICLTDVTLLFCPLFYFIQQIQYCLIDQLLHGSDPPTGAAAQRAVADIVASHSALPHAAGSHPHIRCAAGPLHACRHPAMHGCPLC